MLKKDETRRKIESLKKRFNLIEYVKSQGIHYRNTTGRNLMIRCLSHDDKNPSMMVCTDHFYCFGCGAHGDQIAFVMMHRGISFVEAIELMDSGAMSQMLGNLEVEDAQPVKQLSLLPPNNEDVYFYERILKLSNKTSYLLSRGISPESIARFHLGYGKPKRTKRFIYPRYTIPIYDKDGLPVTIRYRADPSYDEEGAKYLTMPRTSSFLFNTSTLHDADFVVYTGSQIDAILLEQHGIKAVGSAGESVFKKGWGELFEDIKTVILLDNDAAGEYGSIKAWLNIKNSVIARWPEFLPPKYDINQAIMDNVVGIDGVKNIIYSCLR